MPFKHTVAKSVISPSGQVADSNKEYEAGLNLEIDEAVADGETDLEIIASIDVSEVKSFLIISDQAVLIETNDGSSPTDSITLKANKAYQWDEDSYDRFQLNSGDITSFFVTNASGRTANFKIRCIYDPTP